MYKYSLYCTDLTLLFSEHINNYKGFWRFTHNLHSPIAFPYKTLSCPSKNSYSRCLQGLSLPRCEEIPCSTVLAWHSTAQWGEETPQTNSRWMGCFEGPEFIALQWCLQGPLKWDTGQLHTFTEHSTSCFKHLPPCSAPWTFMLPHAFQGASHLPPLLRKQWALLHISERTVTTVKNTRTLPRPSPVGFALSGFFSLYLPFPYFPTFRKKENGPICLFFVDAVILLCFNSWAYSFISSIQQVLNEH